MGSITIGTRTVTGINLGTGIDVGTKTTSISENGTYDVNVFGYATNSISVSVSGGGGVDTDFLCFTAEEANSTVGMNIGANLPFDIILYISTDNQQTFTQWDGSTVTLENVGDKMYLYGSNKALASNNSTNQACVFEMTGSIAASGDVTSLLSRYGVDTLQGMEFALLFYNCVSLTTAPSLPSTRVGALSYSSMFRNCTGLTQAPALPATVVAPYCYNYMFYGCTALTTAPALPATTAASYCYAYMFYGCTALTTAPALPATTTASYCCAYMFYGCTALTTAPATLPATTAASYCYTFMFSGCTSLTTAPALPATTLASYCYYLMFQGCTALTTAPATLPATTLANGCYGSMFYGCTSLTTGPDLRNATTLAQGCCTSMFSGCRALTTAYAPDVVQWSTTNMGSWLNFVAATGTLYATSRASAAIPLNTPNGCPRNWTVTVETKSVTLTYSGYDFSWNTSDGRSGSMTSGDPDYTLAIEPGQTVTFTTAGGRDRLSIDGVDQCSGDDPQYTYAYTDLDGGEVITCEHFTDPC